MLKINNRYMCITKLPWLNITDRLLAVLTDESRRLMHGREIHLSQDAWPSVRSSSSSSSTITCKRVCMYFIEPPCKLQQIAYKSTGWPTKLRSLSLTVHVFIMPEPICMNFGTTLCHLIIRETTDVFRKMMLKCTRNHANSFRHFEDVSSSGLGVLGHPVVHAQNTTKTELYYRQLYS